MRNILLITQMFLAMLLLNACSDNASTNEPIRIGITEWVGYQPFSWAEHQYLDTEDAQIMELPSNTEIARLFNNGVLDMICTPLGDALTLAQKNDDLVIIAILDISDGSDTMLVQPGIDSLSSLKGKRIGFEKDGAGTYMIVRILEKAGLAKDEVILKEVNFYNQHKMFTEKKIDGLVTYEPLSAQLVAQGAKKMFDSSMIPDEIFDILITRKQILHERPESVKRILSAWYKASSDVSGKDPAFYDWLSTYLQLPVNVLYEQTAGIKFMNPEEFKTTIYSDKFKGVLKATQELLVLSGQLDPSTDGTVLIDKESIDSLY